MNFMDFLKEGYDAPTPQPMGGDRPTTNKVIITTSFYDAGGQVVPIQISALVSKLHDKTTKIIPKQVKFHGKFVGYDQFLQAIPSESNEALLDPSSHVNTWDAWMDM